MLSKADLNKYHDADVVGINCANLESGLVLTFRLVDGSNRNIQFAGCQFYRVDEMWRQNVVYRILTTIVGTVDDHEKTKMIYNMVRDDSKSSSLPLSKIDSWLSDLRNGSLVLTNIEPSTGAEITIISRSIEEGEF